MVLMRKRRILQLIYFLKLFQPGWINYPFEFRKFRIEILCVVTRLKENSKLTEIKRW